MTPLRFQDLGQALDVLRGRDGVFARYPQNAQESLPGGDLGFHEAPLAHEIPCQSLEAVKDFEGVAVRIDRRVQSLLHDHHPEGTFRLAPAPLGIEQVDFH